MPDEGGLSNTFFSIANFGGPKIISNFLKLSQIFSEYIFMYWHSRKIISNYLKFSQIISNFLKLSQIFSNFLKCSHVFSENFSFFSAKYLPQMMGGGPDRMNNWDEKQSHLITFHLLDSYTILLHDVLIS